MCLVKTETTQRLLKVCTDVITQDDYCTPHQEEAKRAQAIVILCVCCAVVGRKREEDRYRRLG